MSLLIINAQGHKCVTKLPKAFVTCHYICLLWRGQDDITYALRHSECVCLFLQKMLICVSLCPQKSCMAIDFFIGEHVTPHSTLWRMGEAFDARLLKFLCSMLVPRELN